jgi:hypothetical protein
MILILNKPVNYHHSADTVEEFEKAILSSTYVPETIFPASSKLADLAFLNWRFLTKFKIHYTPLSYLNFNKFRKPDNIPHYFTVLMGSDFRKCLPSFMLPVHKSFYMFDAWPSAHDLICQFVDHFKVDHAFISSSQAAGRLNAMLGKQRFYWISEGINPDEYRFCNYNDKNIDVLSFGRQFAEYHYKINEPLQSHNKVYLFARTKETKTYPLFKSRESFTDALSRSKVSICVPSSISNPKRAGEIETMTIRYLQSMISKCLIVGHAPEEMISLFKYNPVVEIDMDNAGSQIMDILSDYPSYFDLIETNYRNVIEGHTWRHRWEKILNITGNNNFNG